MRKLANEQYQTDKIGKHWEGLTFNALKVTVSVVEGYILAHFTLYWRFIIPRAGDLFCSI